MTDRKPSLHKQDNSSLSRRNTKHSLHKRNKDSPLYNKSAKPSLQKNRRNQYSQNRANRDGNQSTLSAIFSQILSVIMALISILIPLIKGIIRELVPIIRKLIDILKKNPKFTRNLCLALIILLVLSLVLSYGINNTNDNEKAVQSTFIGNNTLGSVYKEGPYGNGNSDVKIAYILGVHPREQGAHKLMEQAVKEKRDKLNYSYYLYKINVSSDSTDFEQSRLNGQLLAQEFAVPDMINNNISLAVDVHYSNGHWGVSRFMFTPRENNTVSNEIANAICDNFEWMTYFIPPDPTSPAYVTEPLNDGGVPAIIYEAYTEDPTNVTLEHDREIIDFIDNWNFTSENNTKPFIFF